MPPSGRTKAIQDLVDRGTDALGRSAWFESERVLDRALSMSSGRHDYTGMAEIIDLLATARAGIRKEALASRAAIRIIDDVVSDTMDLERGRYLVQPPLVGADARRLRLLAVAREVPAIALCREPTTQVGLIPIVAIGPLGAVRTRVAAPEDASRPTAGWFRDALLKLGDAAAERIDPAMDPERRLDALIGLLDTVPEDDGLHRTAIETCHEAAAAINS
ncbi:MAG: hypothetical protein QF733_05370 [Phycisphaerales bacterium]|jgi:hypothetical protein|nr:hypothetical protein [Phycisphaerales bacterium]